MIQIEGLTERQKSIMDLLWNCNDMEQVTTLIQALPTHQDQCDAHTLVMIATWESIEQELGLEPYENSACAIIAQCR